MSAGEGFDGKQANRQVQRQKIGKAPIHESGEFCSASYVGVWRQFATMNPETEFYYYTNTTNTMQLDSFPNVVNGDSICPGGELNFGKPEHVEALAVK